MAHHEVDHVSGVTTTGHEWDGIKELNNPLPRWWLYVFYATIVWSFGYFLVYPSWPTLTGYTKGLLGYSQREAALTAVAEGAAARLQAGQGLADATLETIQGDPKLLEFAMANGKAAFGDNCAPCHGSGATGSKGYPNLQDDDWLWGGSLDAIHQTITVGIRSTHEESRISDMPAFGRDGLLERDQIKAVASYVRSLSGLPVPEGADLATGGTVYAENCASCHGEKGEGMAEMGAPNLADAIWLYGSDEKTVVETITNARRGVMPAWDGRLDPVTVKSLAVYVHALGGGS
ncbi:cytochrome-c oxidase, cbb3-type subunit III [Chthonobacter rhizosphaerae]|uniref:cytochrome-c oxidase, cbb3-type subunit III n=1 Tax=Chthonobacter rhizosphaerae TaxID=2735553 RepID=UPI0015EFBEC3|nr:cytochrome-c oxidase, cbb3-type subunit III [Chthonobacter rhizosphaerae]